MILHLRSAQERRKALRLQGSTTKLTSPHSGLSFHEFTNSSSLDATYRLRVSKSSFMFPLKLPHKPQMASCRQRHQAGPQTCGIASTPVSGRHQAGPQTCGIASTPVSGRHQAGPQTCGIASTPVSGRHQAGPQTCGIASTPVSGRAWVGTEPCGT
ncbi:hypothetical protein P7K49_040224 [Saguinus oedipus]|uniref:Uncharacterized protein n=1 Tax=Saguinus oedipus TaxID=9490 RepID=A0ABQ9T8P5_SAGOE|nr:hypothetical protein P7K49_040224 [Saguinus oedipus]